MSRIKRELLSSHSARNSKPNRKRRPFKRNIKSALDADTMRGLGRLLDRLPREATS